MGTIVAYRSADKYYALAFQKDRKVMSEVNKLLSDGSALHVPGNMDSLSEFNFYVDTYDAADYVLQEPTSPKGAHPPRRHPQGSPDPRRRRWPSARHYPTIGSSSPSSQSITAAT